MSRNEQQAKLYNKGLSQYKQKNDTELNYVNAKIN